VTLNAYMEIKPVTVKIPEYALDILRVSSPFDKWLDFRAAISVRNTSLSTPFQVVPVLVLRGYGSGGSSPLGPAGRVWLWGVGVRTSRSMARFLN
jgi:hypothetical protein